MTQTKDQLAPLSTPRSLLLPTTWIAFAIALLGILLIAHPALATASAASPAHTSTFEGEPEEEEEWEEEWEEEESEEEGWEETENEDDGGWEQIFDEEWEEAEEPKQCPLGSVRPRAYFDRDRGDLYLDIHYTAYSTTSVDIDFWLKGDRGPVALGSTKRQLSDSGIVHLDRHLGRGKVKDAPVVIVEVKTSSGPSHCRSHTTRRLTAKHSNGHGHQGSNSRKNRRH